MAAKDYQIWPRISYIETSARRPKILRRPHTMQFARKSPVENELSAGASIGAKDSQAKLNGLINSGAG
jgi:hypothetical protein